MTAEQIVYVVILAWLATSLGLGYGWSRAHIRANRAEQREGVLTATLDARDEQHDEDTARLAAEFSRLLDRADQAARDAMADVDLLRGAR